MRGSSAGLGKVLSMRGGTVRGRRHAGPVVLRRVRSVAGSAGAGASESDCHDVENMSLRLAMCRQGGRESNGPVFAPLSLKREVLRWRSVVLMGVPS
jgi:hypothetical protein